MAQVGPKAECEAPLLPGRGFRSAAGDFGDLGHNRLGWHVGPTHVGEIHVAPMAVEVELNQTGRAR